MRFPRKHLFIYGINLTHVSFLVLVRDITFIFEIFYNLK